MPKKSQGTVMLGLDMLKYTSENIFFESLLAEVSSVKEKEWKGLSDLGICLQLCEIFPFASVIALNVR